MFNYVLLVKSQISYWDLQTGVQTVKHELILPSYSVLASTS